MIIMSHIDFVSFIADHLIEALLLTFSVLILTVSFLVLAFLILKYNSIKKKEEMNYIMLFLAIIFITELQWLMRFIFTSQITFIELGLHAISASLFVSVFYRVISKYADFSDIIELRFSRNDVIPTEGAIKNEYHFEPGAIYLLKEKRSDAGFNLFVNKLRSGHEGLCLTMENPSKIKEKYNISAPIMRINADFTRTTRLDNITVQIAEFLGDNKKNSVIFIDSMERFITNTDFKSVIHFIQLLKDLAIKYNGYIIISIDPKILDPKELALIEQECIIINTELKAY